MEIEESTTSRVEQTHLTHVHAVNGIFQGQNFAASMYLWSVSSSSSMQLWWPWLFVAIWDTWHVKFTICNMSFWRWEPAAGPTLPHYHTSLKGDLTNWYIMWFMYFVDASFPTDTKPTNKHFPPSLHNTIPQFFRIHNKGCPSPHIPSSPCKWDVRLHRRYQGAQGSGIPTR